MSWTIKNAIVEGLQKLVLLRLDYTPAQGTFAGVVQVWLEVIAPHRSWNEKEDRACVDKAFADIIRNLRRFPTPADFFHYLPPRESAPRLFEASEPLSDEEKAEIERIFADMNTSLTMPTAVEPTELRLEKGDGTCTTIDAR